MNKLFVPFCIFLLGALVFSCTEKTKTLFKEHDADDTGITFRNEIVESDSFNILSEEYLYNGGGIGIADFNNDGLQDIFFSGNQVANKLYLNKGGFEFADVTDKAGVSIPGKWSQGVAVVDINNDGWKDIYVCATMMIDSADRANMLFVNQGKGPDGTPVFKEQAAQYGINDMGYSVNAAFLDYDRDGDLDLYILTNQHVTNAPTNYRPKITDGTAQTNDRFYRNNGNGTFTNATIDAGITIEGYGLGLAVCDFNKDGWPDIYVSNDFLTNDILYINQKNGTFKNMIAEYIGHQSQFSMGNDAADVNNDGRPDIITLDMLPEIYDRKKTTNGNKNYLNYINNEKYGYEYQYVRNMLHINNGLEEGIAFSELGQLAGVYQTEWSWSPLFVDFDNDGHRDLFITNGFPKDITDRDFVSYRSDVGHIASDKSLIDSIPVVKIPNYAFKNNGDLTFTDVSAAWGLNKPSFTNGAAFSDFDNDGDLDYVTNNINDVASVYENTLYTDDKDNPRKEHFLRITLHGPKSNIDGIGAKITLKIGDKLQYHDHSVYRGFLSSVEDVIHFGIGNSTMVDSLVVVWPDERVQHLVNVPSDKVVTLDYKNSEPGKSVEKPTVNKMFQQVNNVVSYKHNEEDFIDYNIQRTIPHKFSQQGPGISVGDVNGDGLEDFFVGGSRGNQGTLFIQSKDGSFSVKPLAKESNKPQEDEGALFFDADNDNDLDLYIVSGGFEAAPDDISYRDRFFRNDGKGGFVEDAGAIPTITASKSCVRAADFDRDGDLDLFVGGRVVPGKYPYAAQSYILLNTAGKFEDATDRICASLKSAGMITDAMWTDFDNDGKTDLIVVGEFMPVTLYRNDGNILKLHNQSGLENHTGWWNSIVGADFDGDNDIDYVAGNLGMNNYYKATKEHPLKVVAKDIDGNNSVDAILACYFKSRAGTMELYPVHFWDELNSQSPKFRKKFSRYKHFAKARLEDLLTEEERKDALVLEANYTQTSYLENLGGGKFKVTALPWQAQVAPVNGMVAEDVNHDGNTDIIMVGNDFGNEIFSGRFDAFMGLILLGDGKGSFRPVPVDKSGFYVKGDAKALVKLQGAKRDLFIATQNRDSLKVFTQNENNEFTFTPSALDVGAEVVFEDGRKQKIEFCYGSGYLSQSTRAIRISGRVREMIVYDSRGKKRTILPKST